jgi:hypothetical protein
MVALIIAGVITFAILGVREWYRAAYGNGNKAAETRSRRG